MTKSQAAVLFIVVQAAKRNGWRVPTGRQLVELLHEHGVANIHTRAANAYIKRLDKSTNCFKKIERVWWIDPSKLCTEPDTAQYFLTVDKMAVEDKHGRVNKTLLHALLQSKLDITPDELESIFTFGCDEGYLEVFPTATKFILSGYRTKQQKQYLELLAPVDPGFYEEVELALRDTIEKSVPSKRIPVEFRIFEDENPDLRVEVSRVVPEPERWLDIPHDLLDNQRPRDLIDAGEHQRQRLRDLLRAIKHGMVS